MNSRCSYHNQVHKWYCIETNVPQPHDTEHVDQNHRDGNADQHACPQLEAQQHRRHHKYGCQRDAQVQDRVIHDGEVLLVKHVEDAAKEEKTH